MTDIDVVSRSTEGYATSSAIGDWELTIDATDQEGPNPNAVLAADYASCFIPAFRVGANKEGFDDLGTIEVIVHAALDENEDLESISFDISVEESLGDAVDDVVARAEDICHVHAALRDDLQADISVADGANL
jgi:organic hydroperoxide reductase OsmC/OhrA